LRTGTMRNSQKNQKIFWLEKYPRNAKIRSPKFLRSPFPRSCGNFAFPWSRVPKTAGTQARGNANSGTSAHLCPRVQYFWKCVSKTQSIILMEKGFLGYDTHGNLIPKWSTISTKIGFMVGMMFLFRSLTLELFCGIQNPRKSFSLEIIPTEIGFAASLQECLKIVFFEKLR